MRLFLLLVFPFYLSAQNFTPTHDSIIKFYKALDKQYPEAKLLEVGQTDIGRPLHLFILSKNKEFEIEELKEQGKLILLINNGIHPGEPDGINACMEWSRDLLKNKSLPKDVVICVIPVYNVDGALNRSCCSRANQDGPEEYGFRGNAQNLDLNRDFIKCDSKNAKSFTKLFRKWDPDLFVDNHVSDGADYQYTLTLISTQKDKLGKTLAKVMTDKLEPALQDYCTKNNFPFCPYVNTFGETPESGLVGFMETPRYSTGYAALFHTIGFVVETHMLKPFDQRVKATRVFLEGLLEVAAKEKAIILSERKKAKEETKIRKEFVLDWDLDTTFHTGFIFMGYTAMYKKSELTGKERLRYERRSPTAVSIKYFNTYNPTSSIQKPAYYVVPQAWGKVIDLLKLNKVKMQELKKDSVIKVEVYYLEEMKTGSNPYEGHYVHSNIKVRLDTQEIKYYKGDKLIYTNQDCNRYIVETLEPQGIDSWVTWGFFDAIFQQKEWFSDYVFEEKAAQILLDNPKLKEQFEKKKASDPLFEADAFAQLYFIYKNSPYYEKTHRRYPVTRSISQY